MLLAEEFQNGGDNRMRFTLPPCIFSLLKCLMIFPKKKKLINYICNLTNKLRVFAKLFVGISLEIAMAISSID